jgi:hypothetical protein
VGVVECAGDEAASSSSTGNDGSDLSSSIGDAELLPIVGVF